MPNVKLVFSGSFKSDTNDHTIVTFANVHNEIYFSIDMDGYPTFFICLDKETAIKFSKELRKQISYLESEVKGG